MLGNGKGRLKNKLVCSFLCYEHIWDVISPALPYKWRQELGELSLVVPIPKGTRAKGLDVVVGKKKLSLGLKGQDKILDGELFKEIKVEDSTWTVGSSIAYNICSHEA